MNKSSKDPGSIYLPERYKQQIETKKRRRLIKKIFVICAVVALISASYLILSGALPVFLNKPTNPLVGSMPSAPEITPMSPSGESVGSLTQNMTGIRNADIILGKGLPTQPTSDMQSLDNATASLRQDYPESDYSLISVNLTDLYGGRICTNIKSNRSVPHRMVPGFRCLSMPDLVTSILPDRRTPE